MFKWLFHILIFATNSGKYQNKEKPLKCQKTSKFREFMSPAIIVYYLRIISKPHAYLQTMSKTTVKLRTQGTHYLFTLIVKTLKND